MTALEHLTNVITTNLKEAELYPSEDDWTTGFDDALRWVLINIETIQTVQGLIND